MLNKTNYTKEFKIGVFTIVSIAVIYIGFQFLKGIDVFTTESRYYVVYDNTAGLQEANQVVLNGVQVGRVSEISLIFGEKTKVLVALDVNGDLPIYTNTKAILEDNGLLGDKVVRLDTEFPHELLLLEDDTLQGVVDDGMVAAIKEAAEPIITNLNASLDSVRLLVGEYRGTGDQIKVLLQSTNSLVAKNQGNINKAVEDFTKTAENFSEASKELKPLLAKFNTLADSLNDAEIAQTVADARSAIQKMDEMITSVNDPNGTVGSLIHKREMHDQLVHSLSSLDSLLIDMKANPKKYVNFSIF